MIIGTAGHIDHGKSALVTALTGRSVDRLAEEKRRGITIELNFAPLLFPGLPPAGIVDVPGHEDFVRTMVAGATGIDLVLLVVDLVEGPRPQTEEHLTIVEQLRIERGIPVFTKVDLVDPDWAELVVAELEARLARSPVAFEPAAIVSSVTGQGIPELAARLEKHVAAGHQGRTDDWLRLPIDRAFSVAGVGTVVTGTTWSGTVRPGDSVRLLPLDQTARVRSVESYGEERAAAAPGTRTALGLVGVERAALERGHVAVGADEAWSPSTALDVEIELVAGHALAARSRVRVHLGTAEVLARVHPRAPLGAGGRGLARLALEEPLVARGGDRFVLRSYSPVATIGGGRVIDPVPPRRAPWPEGIGDADSAARLRALAERRGHGIEAPLLPLVTGLPPREAESLARRAKLVAVAERWVPPAVLEAIAAEAMAAVERHHRTEPTQPGISRETLRRALDRYPAPLVDATVATLERDKRLVHHEGVVARAGFRPASVGGAGAVDQLIDLIVAARYEPPDTAELARALAVPTVAPLIKVAVERGAIAAVERDRFYSRDTLDRFVDLLQSLGAAGEITPARVRESINASRKFLIPLLEWADRQGVTRRQGDSRVLVRNGRDRVS
jgi:selenocysteine-specific elongation factor